MGKKTTLGLEMVPMLKRLRDVLNDYDQLTQQKMLELALANHVMRVGRNREEKQFVIDSVAKHVRQIVEGVEIPDREEA